MAMKPIVCLTLFDPYILLSSVPLQLYQISYFLNTTKHSILAFMMHFYLLF